MKKTVIFIFSALIIQISSLSQDDLKEDRTIHFIVRYYSDVDVNFLRKLKNAAEKAYRDIANDLHFFREEPWTFDNRACIYVYENRDRYLKETGMPQWSAGAADMNRKTVYTYDGAWDVFRYILKHELTHLIFREYVGHNSYIPKWLNEAAAVYMEQDADRSQRAAQVKDLLESSYIPLKQLFDNSFTFSETVDAEGSLTGTDRVRAFYLESFSVLYFLIERYSAFKFHLLCRDMREGKDFDEAFFDNYRSIKDIDDLENKWKEFYK